MLHPRQIRDGALYARDQGNVLGLFFVARLLGLHGKTRSRERTRLPESKEKSNFMKKLSVVVAGTGQIRDIEIQPGTTAGDVLHQLNLSDYLLSKGPNDPFFPAAESIYDKVNDGEKIFASTKAEVGIPVWA
jgi:hypothetical protein